MSRSNAALVPIVALAFAGLCAATGGCREGSRRDMVVTRPSATTSAASSAPSVAIAPSTSASIEVGADAGSEAAVANVDAALPPGSVAYGAATLSGKVAEETFFGPPGYGSDPGHDKKETVLVLQLPQPVDVLRPPDDTSDFDVDRLAVSKVSLTDPKDAGVDLHKLVGQRITVKGTLFGAHTAHHHTDVLMSGVDVVPQ
jgi:hypothetical protein